MALFARRVNNYDLYANHAWYVPGVGGMFGLLGWFLVGNLLGSLVTFILGLFVPADIVMQYGSLIAYPIAFIPAMMYVAVQSRNRSMDSEGFALDSSHFAPLGGFAAALLVMLGTFAAAFATDAISSAMPPMPEWLESLMQTMTGGELWVDFLLVSIMAPLFEEWLCRGMVLRGLLNSGKVKPLWAIVISAVFFAVIHMNPWQAIPAFILGALFGYVYYKTGSLRLTMLMHFTNNTLALAAGHIWPDVETWKDIAGSYYWLFFVLALVVVGLVLLAFSKIEKNNPAGNCDRVPAVFSE